MMSFVMAMNIIILAFICVKEAGNSLFLETALRLGINIPCQGISIIHNITEFPFLLTSENITPEVKIRLIKVRPSTFIAA